MSEHFIINKIGFFRKKHIYLEAIMQNLLHEPSINGIVINFRDISSRMEIEKQMAYINTHDKLTGLPNANYCTRKLRLQCEEAKEKRTTLFL